VGLKRHDHVSTTGKTWHEYRLDGYHVPGVTTILDKTLAKPELVDWAARMVAAAASDEETWYSFDDLARMPERIKREAADRGHRVHARAATFLQGIDPGKPEDDIAGNWAAFLDWYDTVQPEPLAVEFPVANRTWQVAGTVDLAAAIGGKRRIVDFKAGKRVYVDAAIQTPAYRNMEVYVTDSGEEAPMADLDLSGCQIVHLRADGRWDAYNVNEDGDAPWQVFQRLAWVYRMFKDAEDHAWLELVESGAAVTA
jgi:hypothetical protein